MLNSASESLIKEQNIIKLFSNLYNFFLKIQNLQI
jgi:hypothetical protein